MRTGLDCFPCFMDQALRGARLAAPDDEATQRDVLAAWGRAMAEVDLDAPPVLAARRLFDIVEALTGVADPFAGHKERANRRVLELLPRLERLVAESADPLLAALELSILGNAMDVGVRRSFAWEEELADLGRTLDTTDLEAFRRGLRPGAEVLVLGDNAGEIGLDRILAGRLRDLGCRVAYAVRSRPILNDATLEDARTVGLDAVCEVLDSGCPTPGVVLELCSRDFLARLERADLVLSKGQGNFEALEGRLPGVFFAFRAKCERVTGALDVPLGASLFVQRS